MIVRAPFLAPGGLIPEPERRDWGTFLAKRTLRRRGLAAMFNLPHTVLYPPEWADLLNIYDLVRRRKPKVIIEFGSGCSTLMFAKALADNGHADAGWIKARVS